MEDIVSLSTGQIVRYTDPIGFTYDAIVVQVLESGNVQVRYRPVSRDVRSALRDTIATVKPDTLSIPR